MALQMIFAPPPAPTVVAATGCPHYLTVAYVERTGRHDRCAGCLERPATASVAQHRGRPRTRTRHQSGRRAA